MFGTTKHKLKLQNFDILLLLFVYMVLRLLFCREICLRDLEMRVIQVGLQAPPVVVLRSSWFAHHQQWAVPAPQDTPLISVRVRSVVRHYTAVVELGKWWVVIFDLINIQNKRSFAFLQPVLWMTDGYSLFISFSEIHCDLNSNLMPAIRSAFCPSVLLGLVVKTVNETSLWCLPPKHQYL